ncbi:hypothetical protein [Rheinheimera sp.]|uniref:hypothetical protein n=1 Tax=Rheinheimera sp. TaxID=1869214 RepID=UPI00307CEFF4
MNRILDGIKFLIATGFLAAVFVAIFQHYSTESAKQAEFERIKKEESYKKLLYSLRGFYPEIVGCMKPNDINKLRLDFSIQMDYCMLYCSDEVVQATNELMIAVSNKQDSDTQTAARNKLMIAIRDEFLPNSQISEKDYIALNPINESMACDFTLHNNQIHPTPKSGEAD